MNLNLSANLNALDCSGDVKDVIEIVMDVVLLTFDNSHHYFSHDFRWNTVIVSYLAQLLV